MPFSFLYLVHTWVIDQVWNQLAGYWTRFVNEASIQPSRPNNFDPARLIFFATAYGEHTESALPLLNLSDFLTLHNVYRFQILKFTYLWHKGLLPKLFPNYFQYASNVHKYDTRYASIQNLCVKKVRTNKGKQTIGYAACIIWDKVPLSLKELNIHQFSKQLKPYLLSEQHN